MTSGNADAFVSSNNDSETMGNFASWLAVPISALICDQVWQGENKKTFCTTSLAAVQQEKRRGNRP